MIKCMLDKKTFERKPNNYETGGIQKRLIQTEVEIKELAEKLGNGATFKPAFLGGTKSNSWINQQIFALDFDGETTIQDELDKCNELNILEYCACDILDKIKYQRKNELKESLNNPIIVKLESPVLSDFNSINKDTYEDVMNHINRVKKFIATNEINKDMLKMDRSAYDLLDTAINRLHLTVNSIENIKNVAVIIAVMDHFSFGIKAQHVSEAVSFQCYRFMNDVI